MRLLSLAVLALLVALTVVDMAPRGTTDAARHVEAIAKAPHPTGSAEQTRVRDHLVAELRGMGLETRVQEAVGALPLDYDGMIPMGTMRNIVAVLPGTAPTGRVVVAAHYDSVPAGPGASDDGAGVAALLETAEKLPRTLRNDVVFLLTDGEEQGLLGADAFVRNDPLAKGTVVVLNNEARGVRGTAMAFRTSPGAGGLMGLYGSAVPQPVADSGFAAIMSVLPNNTDFFTFAKAGWKGIDSAFVGGGAYYHTPLDDPAHLDRGSLAQMAGNTLAMAEALGQADLGALGTSESVYFNIPGLFVRYPAWLELPIALLALAAAVALVVVLRRRGLLTLPRTLLSAPLALLPLVLGVAVALSLWPVLGMIRPEYTQMFTGDPYRPWLFQAALVALTVAVVALWYGLSRLVGGVAMAAGAVLLIAVLGVAMAVLAPLGSHTLAWPALGASLGWLVSLRASGRWRFAALTVGMAPAAIMLGGAAMTSLDLGLKIGGVIAGALLALLLLLVLPLFDGWRPLVPLGAAVLAVVLAGAGLVTDTFDGEHPRQTEVSYALDAGTGKAVWNDGRPAPVAPLTAPEVKVLDQSGKTVRLRLIPTGKAPIVGLETDADTVTVAGRELNNGFSYFNPPAEGLEVTLTGATKVRAFEEAHDMSVVPGYKLPDDTVNRHPATKVFRDQNVGTAQ
ncbi:M20/M25/M40 family metallo-hydrolase [Nonomuraea sp. NPDC050556]|uniref:M20/M25/M40 family metallo-hydrolase n=1 Tax=Nonomuraea sp. NPDC050556 TaxID=3364369 RepID=UPI0037A46990